MRRCFAWKMLSSDRCISAVRFTSIFNIEKSDSTDVVLASTVASPPQNERIRLKRPGAQSHASLKVVVWSCLSMMSCRIVSVLYSFRSSRCSASICSTLSLNHNEEMCCQNGSSTSFKKMPWCSLTIWAGSTGGASFFDARLSSSRLALIDYKPATSAIAYVVIWLIMSWRVTTPTWRLIMVFSWSVDTLMSLACHLLYKASMNLAIKLKMFSAEWRSNIDIATRCKLTSSPW